MSELEEFEDYINKPETNHYILKLYISGMTPNSKRAIENIKKICEDHLKQRYELQIIDIFQEPRLAEEGNIFAAPTLIRQLPHPLRTLIGDMSNTEKVLLGLDIIKKEN